MHKVMLEKSLDVLIESAEECAELAKAQRASADQQHANASEQYAGSRKLEEMSKVLKQDALEIKEELAIPTVSTDEDVRIQAERTRSLAAFSALAPSPKTA